MRRHALCKETFSPLARTINEYSQCVFTHQYSIRDSIMIPLHQLGSHRPSVPPHHRTADPPSAAPVRREGAHSEDSLHRFSVLVIDAAAACASPRRCSHHGLFPPWGPRHEERMTGCHSSFLSLGLEPPLILRISMVNTRQPGTRPLSPCPQCDPNVRAAAQVSGCCEYISTTSTFVGSCPTMVTYANSDGMVISHLSPSTISCIASVQPLIT